MNYFEFYDIPVSFKPDKLLIRKKYIEISRSSHPDFFAGKGDLEKEISLEKSTINTKAYQVLNADEHIIPYVLSVHGMVEEGEKYTLPQNFLMDMMDINEQLMDLEIDFNNETFLGVKKAVEEKQKEIIKNLLLAVDAYEADKQEADLFAVKDAWYRKKYLLRIQQRLNTFASPLQNG